ncbi:MAG: hypothetical protein JSS89_12100 [Bacteroidetes bacterium]|nr:hypothetical protein [Bacteroidota bacterium]
MSTRYAADTSVSVEKSRSEIERLLLKYGASSFMYAWGEESAMIMFKKSGRTIKFVLPLPNKDADEFWLTTARRNPRTPAQAYESWEQACRQRWRALCLVIKAKLEAVETGITTFEQEFLPHMLTATGQTVAEQLIPRLGEVMAKGSGDVFKMLTDGRSIS